MSESMENVATGKGIDSVVVDIVVRLAFLSLLAYWSLLLIGPFITVVLWGIVLTVALYPIFTWLRARLGGRGSLAATLITIVLLLIVIGPTSLLATALIDSLHGLSQRMEAGTLHVPPPADSVQDRAWRRVGCLLYNRRSRRWRVRPRTTSPRGGQ